MAEELSEYLTENGVHCSYIHSDVETFERVEILEKLRQGEFDVIVGVNLLREGLDLPEVSLVAILDADKEGFLRSHRSLTQTIGRAARNVNGMAILYGDKITHSMQLTIDETNRRRKIQMQYNADHGITPTQIRKTYAAIREHKQIDYLGKAYIEENIRTQVAAEDPVTLTMTPDQLRHSIEQNRRFMQEAAKKLDFMQAALYRDEMLKLQELLESHS
jgi:excinuclease ABC subunit B